MNNKNAVTIVTTDRKEPLPAQTAARPTLVKKIGKTTYRVTIHFSATNSETMSDKIKRMLRNEISQM